MVGIQDIGIIGIQKHFHARAIIFGLLIQLLAKFLLGVATSAQDRKHMRAILQKAQTRKFIKSYDI